MLLVPHPLPAAICVGRYPRIPILWPDALHGRLQGSPPQQPAEHHGCLVRHAGSSLIPCAFCVSCISKLLPPAERDASCRQHARYMEDLDSTKPEITYDRDDELGRLGCQPPKYHGRGNQPDIPDEYQRKVYFQHLPRLPLSADIHQGLCRSHARWHDLPRKCRSAILVSS